MMFGAIRWAHGGLRMNTRWSLLGATMLTLALGAAAWQTQYKVHDRNRPAPKEIDPGTWSSQEAAGRAPSDATVLFDGKDFLFRIKKIKPVA